MNIKKTITACVLFISMPLFASAAIYPTGCTSSIGYSPTTGKLCVQIVVTSLPDGCTSTVGYSPKTGARCIFSDTTSLPTGCSSASGYSPTSGHSCSINEPIQDADTSEDSSYQYVGRLQVLSQYDDSGMASAYDDLQSEIARGFYRDAMYAAIAPSYSDIYGDIVNDMYQDAMYDAMMPSLSDMYDMSADSYSYWY